MNPEKAQRLEKATLKAARKAQRRHPGQPVTREELLQLRVQMVPTWARLLLALPGLGLIGGGIWLAINSTLAGGGFVALIGLGLLLGGIFGRRKILEDCLSEFGVELGLELLKAVLNSLDGF